MCGIAGSISLAGELSPDDVEIVRRLNRHQRRRGPDGEGLAVSRDKRVALGQRRLAIIDVGDSGAQPMSDVSGRWTITFNGEIYNYRELRRDLEHAGRKFRTQSDTEVLINCIAEWGEDGLRRLRGMYAFALWDDEEKELWLARDPLGVKPLYYAKEGSTLWFASQARSLAECAHIDASRNSAGLVGFYLWGYVPEPFTWWEGVYALPAGSLLRVGSGGMMPEPRLVRDIETIFADADPAPMPREEIASALMDSIRHHFIADVNVGVFLSAGVDSTVIAAFAKDAGFDLQTVTIAFDEYRNTLLDEAPLAEETARELGADHQTFRITRTDFDELFNDFMGTMDQPTTDGLNAYLVSRAAASAGLKVALSGLGGDELFGGYPSFRQAPRLVATASKLPRRDRLAQLVNYLFRPLGAAVGVSPKLAAGLLYARNVESAYFLRRCLYLPDELEMLLDESWRRSGFERLEALLPRQEAESGHASSLSPHAAVSKLEISRYMRNQPLRDTDWASMAHSLEVRVPFLDTQLLARLAGAIRSEKPPSKQDLAACAGPIATRLLRRAKTGFVTPVASWLKEGPARARGLRPWADKVATHFRHVGAKRDASYAATLVD